MSSSGYVVLVIAAAVGLIVVATARWRVHPFLALIGAALGVGLACGLGPDKTLEAVTGGFGRTMGYIGIVIAAGCIIGTILERSGGALAMADAVLRVVGRGRSVLAMSITGAIVSVPVFCDSGYVILSPLNRSLARAAKRSMAAFATALSMGLYATHCLVPPTPGPLAGAGELRADLGAVIIWGLVVSVPVVAATFAFATYIGRRLPIEPPAIEAAADSGAEPARIGATAAFTPILFPVVAIALRSVAELPSHPLGDGLLRTTLRIVGDPNVALLLGVILAVALARRAGTEKLGQWSGEALRSAGIILLITCAGGAFGAVLRQLPLAAGLQGVLGALDLGAGNILWAFLIAAAFKTAIGSSTVAIITTASLVSPLLPALGLDPPLARAFTTLAIGAGSMVVSHVNDSYFWVITQMSGLSINEGYRTVTVGSAVAGATGAAAVFLLHLVLR